MGPEFAFGVRMHEKLKQPILIIKTAWGGKSLFCDFRPPGAEPYQYRSKIAERAKKDDKFGRKLQRKLARRRKNSGVYYKAMVNHVRTVLDDPGKHHPAYDSKEGYELAGFVWFQGFNDLIDGHTYPRNSGSDAYKKYTRLLTHFIRDLRKDLQSPRLPFVIGVMGIGGNQKPDTGKGAFQKAQAAPAEMSQFDNVVAVRTGDYWDHKLAELSKRWRNKVQKPYKKKRKDLGQEKAKELRQELIDKHFTEEELKYLEVNKSNGGFHYFGSARIYSQIGEAFTRALLEMRH